MANELRFSTRFLINFVRKFYQALKEWSVAFL